MLHKSHVVHYKFEDYSENLRLILNNQEPQKVNN